MKQSEIRINVVPPKIKNLQVKQIWQEIREDEVINSYFPDACFELDPPRHYFFAVLATLRHDILTNLLQRAETAFNEKQERMNNTVALHPRISNELNAVNWKSSILNSRPDKRISFGQRQ